ncbi:ankyrin repeat protein [Apiospora saccharicola]
MPIPPEQLGLSKIHIACLNGDSRKVDEIVQAHPESIEQTAPDGTTPLMLAALMGHLEIFRFLLWDRSADIHKETTKGMKAADHARETDFAKLARTEYIEAGLAEENPLAASNRKGILSLLFNPSRRIIAKRLHRQGGDAAPAEMRLAPNGSKLDVYARIDSIETGVPLPDIKTLGFIMPERDGLPICSTFDFARHSQDAAAQGPSYFAGSGWKTSHRRNPQVVDSELWTWVAHKLVAPRFGHVFPRGRDNGNLRPEPEHIGRVQASHVEVQLSTFYVFSLTEALVARRPDQHEAEYIREQFHCLLDDKVRKKMTLGARRTMVIFIDSWPCKSCQDYVDIVGKLAGISFRIEGGRWIGSYPESRAAQMTPKGARWAPPDDELVDVEDRLAQAKAAVARNPNLMENFRYRLERDAAAIVSPAQAKTDQTPALEDDDDEDEDIPDAIDLITPPPDKAPEVSVEKQMAFRDHINQFAFQAKVERNVFRRVQKKPRYAPYIVPDPLAFKPFPPTPVLFDPFVDRTTSPESGDETIADSREDDGEEEEEGGQLYSNLRFRLG